MDKVTESTQEATVEQAQDDGAGSDPLTEAFTVDAAKVRARARIEVKDENCNASAAVFHFHDEYGI